MNTKPIKIVCTGRGQHGARILAKSYLSEDGTERIEVASFSILTATSGRRRRRARRGTNLLPPPNVNVLPPPPARPPVDRGSVDAARASSAPDSSTPSLRERRDRARARLSHSSWEFACPTCPRRDRIKKERLLTEIAAARRGELASVDVSAL